MSDISIRIEGRAGRITLQRPQALNALTYPMCLAIDQAFQDWESADIDLVLIDAEGDRAFCSGGDIAEMYSTGIAGDFAYGQRFWRDEYRMNARIFAFPKPVVTFLQGFTMGGGVGVGCHGSHRIVGESSQVAMPECGIGLVPDVGGSLILARAPGRLGEYLGTTATRMGPGDAILAGFADHFVPEAAWSALKARLVAGDLSAVTEAAEIPDDGPLSQTRDAIDWHFSGETLGDILRSLRGDDSAFARDALKKLGRNSPLGMACAVEMVHRLRGAGEGRAAIERALGMEYRFTHRAMEHGDFLEGIRAAIIDKDRSPNWRHSLDSLDQATMAFMVRPLGADALRFEEEATAMKIGFIGLGNMGAPMAANLVKSGHTVMGFDVAAPVPEGVSPAASASEAARGADLVITMLPNGEILRAVAGEIHPVMAPGAVHLDCSTVDVASAQAVAEQAAAAGCAALDAPVSGGVGGAAAGTLTFMVGGDPAAYHTALPLFEIMGQKSVLCGGPGMGQAAKICNNMILGVTMIATCEAFALADKLGLDRQSMFDVVSTSSGYSWSMNAYCPAPGIGPDSPADNGYQPGFAADLMLKDLRLAQQAAQAADADTPLGQAAMDLYRQFVEDEDGAGRDFSAMLPRLAARGRS